MVPWYIIVLYIVNLNFKESENDDDSDVFGYLVSTMNTMVGISELYIQIARENAKLEGTLDTLTS